MKRADPLARCSAKQKGTGAPADALCNLNAVADGMQSQISEIEVMMRETRP